MSENPSPTSEVEAIQFVCERSLCGHVFLIPSPNITINNGSPFCVAIFAQPPFRCPKCSQRYIIQLSKVSATEGIVFNFKKLDMSKAADIELPKGKPS